MDGVINKAIEGLVRSKFGDAMWDRIRTRAGVADEPFIAMVPYPDSMTYDLIGAASAELGISAEEVCVAFGVYWILYSAEAGYGDLMKRLGNSLPEFLRDLNYLHRELKYPFPNLAPPRFEVTDETDDGLILHYYSHRAGLEPVVVGMLKGLAQRFGTEVTVTRSRIEQGTPHEIFHVTWPVKAGG